jgi:glycosyltransferase involved in cell wall biosynthesis
LNKIVLIGPYTKSLISFRGELMKQWLAAGHEVIVMAPESGYEEEFAALGVQFCLLPFKRANINPLGDISLLLFLIKQLQIIKPDIVFSYAIKPVIYGSLAARLSGVAKIFSMITGLGYVFVGNSFKQNLLRLITVPLYRRALSFNHTVFFQNPDDLTAFTSLKIVDECRTVLINGSGVDIDDYCYIEPPSDRITFLLIARLLWDKGILEYVQAAEKIKKIYPSVKFQLLGPYDPNPSSIKAEDIDRWTAADTIEYQGETNNVRPYLAAASVYVLPSYREGTPRSVLEAMAIGRPIVTTDAPGCRETVRDGENGFLVSVKNIEALAEAMEYFILHPEQIKEMGVKSRKIAEDKYDVKKVNEVIIQAMRL